MFMFDFSCNCSGPWKGLVCDDVTTPCDDNNCSDGSRCVPSTSGGYTCLCALGKTGPTCDSGEFVMVSVVSVCLSVDRVVEGEVLMR